MGPRPRGRGIAGKPPALVVVHALQWGRDRAVAELSRKTPATSLDTLASMGPRPRGRGIGKLVYVTSCAEYRFNGAATARSRNCAISHLCLPAKHASMGPRPRGRGILTTGVCIATHREASMGPRPRGRGIPWKRAKALPPPELQWGRDRAVAEFKHRSQQCFVLYGFNGAATARSRNW